MSAFTAYRRVLGQGDFGRLWLGSSLSLLGDGMTILALTWMVLEEQGTARLGLLGVCLTAPVIVGGLIVGPLLDRFDKRTLMVVDSLLRAACVAWVPITAAVGDVPQWLPFMVAVVYGLLKMVPMAGVPASIPQLVDECDLDTANALESLSFSVATVVGPAVAGVLVAMFGAPQVPLVAAATYLAFAGLTATVRTPLSPHSADAAVESTAHEGHKGQGSPEGQPAGPAVPSIKTVARDRAIVATTVAFMLFNIADGMLLLVVGPWLAKNELPGGSSALGGLVALMAAGEFVGAAVAGSRAGGSGRSVLRKIGVVQVGAALGFLTVLGRDSLLVVGAGFFAVGLMTAPMTVWAQSLRMRRIPPALHGRAFAWLRTLMQGTAPIGSTVAAALLAHGGLAAAALTMMLLAGLPGLYLLLSPGVRGGAEGETASERPDGVPSNARTSKAAEAPDAL
jgi:MFS family permease